MKTKKGLVFLLSIGMAMSLAACSSDTSSSESAASAATSETEETTLTVFAAASLSDSFEEIGQGFEAENPRTTVTFSFAGSQTLVDQIENGAPADVLATANTSTMDKATEAGNVSDSQLFASNTLTLVTPAGNPAGVTGLDSSLDNAKLVICAPEVPCGAATVKLTELLGITLNPVSEEEQVTDVLGKVTSGEADAGIVYKTDAKSAGDSVETIEIAQSDQVVNEYPIAVTTSTEQAALSKKFVEYVLSSAGQDVMNSYGFGSPTK